MVRFFIKLDYFKISYIDNGISKNVVKCGLSQILLRQFFYAKIEPWSTI